MWKGLEREGRDKAEAGVRTRPTIHESDRHTETESQPEGKERYCTFFLFWANFWAVCQAWNKAERRVEG